MWWALHCQCTKNTYSFQYINHVLRTIQSDMLQRLLFIGFDYELMLHEAMLGTEEKMFRIKNNKIFVLIETKDCNHQSRYIYNVCISLGYWPNFFSQLLPTYPSPQEFGPIIPEIWTVCSSTEARGHFFCIAVKGHLGTCNTQPSTQVLITTSSRVPIWVTKSAMEIKPMKRCALEIAIKVIL